MPGIFGHIPRGRAPEGHSARLIAAMRSALTHRPWYVGHAYADERCGLGQVDVPYPGGRGPIFSQDKDVCLMLDGYVFGLMGRAAQEAAGHGDALPGGALTPDLLLRLYRRFGSELASMLDGEFNLAAFDFRSGVLHLMADRFALRKLYWYSDDRAFLFAPEMKALLAHAGLDKTVDTHSVADFIHYGYMLGEKTFFKKVRRIPGGHVLTVAADGAVSLKPYWSFDYAEKRPVKDPGEVVEETMELLKTSVARRLKGYRKPLVFLSGGLDSRLLAALGSAELAKSGHALAGITYGTMGCSEHRLAERVAKHLSLRDYRMLEIKPEYYRSLYRESLWLTEGLVEGFGTTARFGAYKEHVERERFDNIMVGPMGGPILGGSYLKRAELENRDRSHRDLNMVFDLLQGGTADPFLDGLFGSRGADVRKDARESMAEEVEALNRIPKSRSDFKDWLLLKNKCRRAYVQINFNFQFTADNFYFLDYALFDQLYSLPPEIRAGHRLYYELYLRYLPELAQIPYMKTGRPLFEKPRALDEKKKAWGKRFRYYLKRASRGRVEMADPHNYVQYDLWYRRNRDLRALVSEILLDKRTLDRGWLTRAGAEDLLRQERNGQDAFTYIDRLISFEMWNRFFLDGEKPDLASPADFPVAAEPALAR